MVPSSRPTSIMRRKTIVDADLRPSRELSLWLGGAHVCAAVAPGLAGLPAWSAVAIAIVVLGWGAWQIRAIAGLGGRDAIHRIQLDQDGALRLHRHLGDPDETGCISLESVGPWGIILQYQDPSRRSGRLMVWRDQCRPDVFRRLRIATRWGIGQSDGRVGTSSLVGEFR